MIRPQTCPICDKELAPNAALESDWFPFCSKRCRQIDLYRWSVGKYAIIEPLRPDDLDLDLFDEEGNPIHPNLDPDSFRDE